MQVDLSACDTKKTPKFQLEQKNNTKCMNGEILRWWHSCYMTIRMADDEKHHNLTFLIFRWWFLLSIYIPTDLSLFQAIKSTYLIFFLPSNYDNISCHCLSLKNLFLKKSFVRVKRIILQMSFCSSYSFQSSNNQ